MNKIAYMTCVLSLAFTMQACDDFLDSFPQDTVTNENFWKSKEDADRHYQTWPHQKRWHL